MESHSWYRVRPVECLSDKVCMSVVQVCTKCYEKRNGTSNKDVPKKCNKWAAFVQYNPVGCRWSLTRGTGYARWSVYQTKSACLLYRFVQNAMNKETGLPIKTCPRNVISKQHMSSTIRWVQIESHSWYRVRPVECLSDKVCMSVVQVCTKCYE